MPKSRAIASHPLALACLPLLLSLPFWASRLDAQATKVGVELQVNSYTAGLQGFSSVSRDADGDFVVAWASLQDGDAFGVFARRFTSAGTALGAELQVNTYTTGIQGYPSVSLAAGGGFIVAWESDGQDGNGSGVFARRFSSTGAALAAEFQVNSYTEDLQRLPEVSLDADGDFVIAWQSQGQDSDGDGIFARQFSSAGTALAGEFQVNSYTSGSQDVPSVSLDTDGDFVVAWSSDQQDGDYAGIFGRRFSSAGTAQADEFQVNTYTADYQDAPSLSLDANGDFVVAWQSNYQDGSSYGIFARRFSSAGDALADEFQANAYNADEQLNPSVSLGAGGGFVVAWDSFGQDGSNRGVFARRYSSTGVAVEAEFPVNSYTTNSQRLAAVSVDDQGDFVIAWESDGQDGSELGVFAQRFTTYAVLDIDANGATSALTDGLLVLRYLFGFTGTTLTNGVVDTGGCTRCDAASIEAYLATLI